MAVESITTTFTGKVAGPAVAGAVTYLLGPVAGELAVVLIMGILGTLVALADFDSGDKPMNWFQVSKFIFRGVVLSFAFSSITTVYLAGYVPENLNLGYYTLLSAVSFSIGWTSNKLTGVKDSLVSTVSSLLSALRPK